MTDIAIPQDTAKSRLAKPAPKTDGLDDVATAGERIEAFWQKYPDGSILTEIEERTVTTAEHLPYSVYTARGFVRKNADAESPDATAHATRSEADPDPITAAYAQETAETSAVSRALRNLGILAVSRPAPPAPAPAPAPAPVAPVAPAEPSAQSAVALARQMHAMTQVDLAKAMREAGHPWTQAVVSRIERDKRAVTDAEAASLADLIGYRAP